MTGLGVDFCYTTDMTKAGQTLSWDERVEALLSRIPRLRPVDEQELELHFDGEGWRWRHARTKKCSQYWPRQDEVEPRLISQMQDELPVRHGAVRSGHVGEFVLLYPDGTTSDRHKLLPVLVEFWEARAPE